MRHLQVEKNYACRRISRCNPLASNSRGDCLRLPLASWGKTGSVKPHEKMKKKTSEKLQTLNQRTIGSFSDRWASINESIDWFFGCAIPYPDIKQKEIWWIEIFGFTAGILKMDGGGHYALFSNLERETTTTTQWWFLCMIEFKGNITSLIPILEASSFRWRNANRFVNNARKVV